MQVTATMVKELRERTGVGMMECKRFLAEAQGDMECAIGLLRKSGKGRADKKASRTASEGVILIKTDGNGIYTLAEINCETDFVARDEQFLAFCESVVQTILKNSPANIEAVSQLQIEDSNVEEARLKLIGKIGENIQIRRFNHVKLQGDTSAVYLHGRKIGVLVDMNGGNETLARDVAMHIVASCPLWVSDKEVPAEDIEKEKAILQGQVEGSGKPPEIIDKIVQGRLRKFLSEVTLLGQAFVKDPDQSVETLLKSSGATINAFYRLEVGEGIEKKQENFAEEVKAQVKAAES